MTRHSKQQKILDSIKNEATKQNHEIKQITKDIYDQVLSYHRAPGSLNQDSISKAVHTNLWSLNEEERYIPKPSIRATKK